MAAVIGIGLWVLSVLLIVGGIILGRRSLSTIYQACERDDEEE